MEPFTTHRGKVYVLDRADVDTDQIIPKQFLKRVERSGFGQYLFYDWVRDKEIEIPVGSSILVTGRNFGCGSSREHAPWALEDFGFKVIIAPSFADIFYSNCTKVGILPVALPDEVIERLKPSDELEVNLDRQLILAEGVEVAFDFDPNLKTRFVEGLDDIALTLQRADAIDSYES